MRQQRLQQRAEHAGHAQGRVFQIGACLRQLFNIVFQLRRHGLEQADCLVGKGVFAARKVADVKVDENVRVGAGRAAVFYIIFIALRNVQQVAARKIALRTVLCLDVDLVTEDEGKAVVRARRTDKTPTFALLPALRQPVDVAEKMLCLDGIQRESFCHAYPSLRHHYNNLC